MTLSDNLWLSEIVNDRIARPSATDELLVFHYRPTPCANFQCVALPSYPSWKCVASDTNISACLVCNLRRQNKLYQRTGLYWSWVVPIMKKERKKSSLYNGMLGRFPHFVTAVCRCSFSDIYSLLITLLKQNVRLGVYSTEERSTWKSSGLPSHLPINRLHTRQ